VPVAHFAPNLAGPQSRSKPLPVLCSHDSDRSNWDPSSSFIQTPVGSRVTVPAALLPSHTSPRRTTI
jgi:hypothetical protein